MLDPWCDNNVISVLELESRVAQHLSITPHSLAYLDEVVITVSPDLYNELVKDSHAKTRYIAPGSQTPLGINIQSYWLSSGQFYINAIPRYRNFLFIGTKDELKQYEHHGVPAIFLSSAERREIDRAFEDYILDDRGPLHNLWCRE